MKVNMISGPGLLALTPLMALVKAAPACTAVVVTATAYTTVTIGAGTSSFSGAGFRHRSSTPSVSVVSSSTSDTSDSSSTATPVTQAATSSSSSSSSTSTAATSTASTTSSDSNSSSVAGLSWKAGLSGYPGIESLDIFNEWAPYISWYSNYNPVTPNMNSGNHTIVGTPMLWGKGDQCLDGPDGPVDQWRMSNFTTYVEPADTDPNIFFGFYEPDCTCDSSSNIPDVDTGVSVWNSLIAPLKSRGIPLGSPSMCTQMDQTWLSDFSSQGVTWDITSIHVNVPTVEEGQEVVEYFWNTFQKPIWITELTCVDGKTWTSCGDQDTVNSFIDGMVSYLESNPNVVAYGANNGEGVPGVWNLMEQAAGSTQLTPTGQHYLSVLQGLKN